MSSEPIDLGAVPLGQPLARGRTAEIFAWGDGQILKRFHDWFDLESIEYELRLARAVCATGIPAPRPGEIVRVNGAHGLTYERIDGVTMLSELLRRPWRSLGYARLLAEQHALLHGSALRPELPSLHRRLERKLQQASALSERVRAAALRTLATMPEGDRLCHGDFHPGNLLLTRRGPVTIDWIDATCGNPLADVARTTVLVTGAAHGQVAGPVLKAYLRLLHRVYIRRYFRLRPGGQAEYRRWIPIVAAARLSENIAELEPWLLGQAEKLV